MLTCLKLTMFILIIQHQVIWHLSYKSLRHIWNGFILNIFRRVPGFQHDARSVYHFYRGFRSPVSAKIVIVWKQILRWKINWEFRVGFLFHKTWQYHGFKLSFSLFLLCAVPLHVVGDHGSPNFLSFCSTLGWMVNL